MTLPLVLALTALAVALATPAVRLCDRGAGWPLGALLVAALAFLLGEAPAILRGDPLTWSVTWVPDFFGSGIDVEFALRADGLSLVFAALALGIGAIVFFYSAAYLPKRSGNTSFYLIMTAFTLAVLLLVLADDVIVLFAGWELVSIASFLLIARSSGSSGEAGSMRTLILTFFGGLTLLAALATAVATTGTTALTDILSSPAWGGDPTVTVTVAVLIAVSAFTKAAQLPFHLWLPEAMAAATPVSAFLHAAAVVKAGIYLLLRFSTLFGGVAAWNWILIGVGMSTAVMAAAFALQKTDLKQLTAYSTVSHLGWIVATIGVGTPFAIAAAVAHTIGHALFKSSLFMLIGVIDHQAGSRDLRRLGRLYRRMPWTFASLVVAAASMASVPPLLGFVTKESMLEAFLEAPLGNVGVIALTLAAAVGALLTVTYSAKIVVGGMIDPERDHATDSARPEVHEAPVALWLPAALPGLLSLLGLAPGLLDGTLTAASRTVTGTTGDIHLALWHGFTLPLGISVVVLLLGALSIVYRRRLWPAVEGRALFPVTGARLLDGVETAARRIGRVLGSPANSQDPSRHVVWPVLCIAALMLVTLFGAPGIDGVPLAERAPGIDKPLDFWPFAIIALSVAGLIVTRHRLTGAVLIGTVGVGMTLQMLILGAPDVALTQFLVEALVVVIIMMVVRYQPTYFHPVTRRRKIRAGVIAAFAAIAAFLGVFTLLGRHGRSDLAEWYIANAPDITGGTNIVATIIVEFRALDTLGELSVLGMAALVITAVTASYPARPFARGTRPRPFGQSQLNSLPMKKALTLIVPILAVFAAIVFYRGHQNPGGGFVGALIVATVLMVNYLSKGRDQIIGKPMTPIVLTGVGIITALAAGFVGYAQGGFLTPIYGHLFGEHLTTSLIFDGGIFLAVLGMLTAAVNALGGYLRPGSHVHEQLTYSRERTPRVTIESIEDVDKPYPDPIHPNPSEEDDGPDRAVGNQAAARRYLPAGADSIDGKEPVGARPRRGAADQHSTHAKETHR